MKIAAYNINLGRYIVIEWPAAPLWKEGNVVIIPRMLQYRDGSTQPMSASASISTLSISLIDPPLHIGAVASIDVGIDTIRQLEEFGIVLDGRSKLVYAGIGSDSNLAATIRVLVNDLRGGYIVAAKNMALSYKRQLEERDTSLIKEFIDAEI